VAGSSLCYYIPLSSFASFSLLNAPFRPVPPRWAVLGGLASHDKTTDYFSYQPPLALGARSDAGRRGADNRDDRLDAMMTHRSRRELRACMVQHELRCDEKGKEQC
jgi:hypothetical protein